jgi:hypothetical protein
VYRTVSVVNFHREIEPANLLQYIGLSMESCGGLTSVKSPATNPTRTDPGENPGLLGERPATNCLSHGKAKIIGLLMNNKLESI